jgi:hypothetical protein
VLLSISPHCFFSIPAAGRRITTGGCRIRCGAPAWASGLHSLPYHGAAGHYADGLAGLPRRRAGRLLPDRWAAAETVIGEDKSAVTDPGPSHGPILRARAPRQAGQEMWAWITATPLDELAHAYAVADPRSQGSEHLRRLSRSPCMLQRNLLYTGVTWAPGDSTPRSVTACRLRR